MKTRQEPAQLKANNDTLASATTLSLSLFAHHYQQVAIGTFADYLPNASIAALTKTSRLLHGIFQPVLNARRTARVDYLVSLIANSNQVDAEAIIKNNPSLLRYPCSDALGNVTAFQKAIMLKDGMMWQMLAPYFDKLTNGDNERRRQFYATLPTGHFQDGKPYPFDHLVQLVSTAKPKDLSAILSRQPCSNPLSRCLEHFRKHFPRHIAKEAHFNPQHLITALNTYNKVALTDTWNIDQKSVFCRFVLGYIQSTLPLNHLQAFCSEFYNDDSGTQYIGGIEFRRSLTSRFIQSNQAPLISSEPKGLGYDYMISIFQADFITYSGTWDDGINPYARFNANLCLALQALKAGIDKPSKEENLQAKCTLSPQTSPHCSIM